MTDTEKRFKIKKRTRYEELKNKKVRKLIRNINILGIHIIIFIYYTQRLFDGTLFNSSYAFIWSWNLVAGVHKLDSIVDLINEITKLKDKIENNNTELEMDENEKSKGLHL